MIDEDIIYALFDLMDTHPDDMDGVLEEIQFYAPDEQYEYIKDNFDDFYSVWKYHRTQRMEEMRCVIEMKKELDSDDVLDYYNHLPANDEL